MQKNTIRSFALACVCWAATLPLTAAADPGLDSLQGKWVTKKTSPEGQAYTQTIEIRKDKLTFQMADADGDLRLFAKGHVKVAKVGPFNVLAVSDMQAGKSADV